jgi:GNAT superfamily N-acetyltransferase
LITAARYCIRLAGKADFEQIMSLLDEAISWLGHLGLDQWQENRDRQQQHVETDIDAATLFVVENLGKIVATITVDDLADTDFWINEDEPLSALYVHRMAVARAHAGIGLGAAMLDWAAGQVERCGRSCIRLDAWSTNDKLHRYYKQLGFTMVRNHSVEGRGSGALFERAATERHGSGPALNDVPPRASGVDTKGPQPSIMRRGTRRSDAQPEGAHRPRALPGPCALQRART